MKVGIPLVDATKKRIVRIKEEDREATQCNPRHCVVANAIMRQFKDAEDVKVGASTVRVLLNGMWTRFSLTATGRAMVRAYDADGQTMPGNVELELVPPVVRLGTRTDQPKGRGKGSGKPEHVNDRRPSLRNIFVEPPQ